MDDAEAESVRAVERRLQGAQIGGAEHDAVAGGDVDEIEVDPTPERPCEQGRRAHLGCRRPRRRRPRARASDRELRDRKRTLQPAPHGRTRMCSSARAPDPTHVAAARFTPASLTAVATRASAPGVFSTSMTRSNAISARSSVLGALARADPRDAGLAVTVPRAQGRRRVQPRPTRGVSATHTCLPHGKARA